MNDPMRAFKQVPPSFTRFGIVNIVIVFLVVILAYSGFVVVKSGTRGVLMTFGAVQSAVFTPGLHLKWPFIQTVVSMPTRIEKAQTNETASSNDLQVVTTTVAVNFHLDPSKVNTIYRDIGDINAVYQRIVSPAISNAVKAVTAQFNADELVTKRDIVRTKIDNQIRSSVAPYHVIVDAVNITNFEFSPEYDKAIEAKQVAQQQSLQAQYELKRAQIEAQKSVAIAQAKAQSNVVLAQAQAKATILRAEADAKANRLKSSTITPQILQQSAIQQWNGVLPAVMGAGKGGVLPMLSIPGLGKAALAK